MKDLVHNRRISNFNSNDISQDALKSSYFYGVKVNQDNKNFKIQELNFKDPN